MKRYTIHYKFFEEFLPMANYNSLKDIAFHIQKNCDDINYKIFDNKEENWLKPELIFLACVFNSNIKN